MYYPDHARYAKLAADDLGVEFRDLDRGNGYLFAVVGNGRRFLSGAGGICSYPINNASSYTIARDKAHTKSVLSHNAVPIIPGRHFFVSGDYALLRNPGHDADDAPRYAAGLGYPVFCKPLTGGRGNFAEIVRDLAELRAYIARLATRYEAFSIERIIGGDEYRVLVHDGQAISCVTKGQARIQADGTSSIGRLLDQLNDELTGTGVSAYTEAAIMLSGFTTGEIPPAGTTILLSGRRNLGAFGVIESFDTNVPPPLARLAITSCVAIGLRLGAVDIFDVSYQHDLSELLVIEVNGNPGLVALEQAGRLDIIIALWKAMIREVLDI